MRDCASWLSLWSEPFLVLEVREAFREEHEGTKTQTREGTLPCANRNLLDMCPGEMNQPQGWALLPRAYCSQKKNFESSFCSVKARMQVIKLFQVFVSWFQLLMVISSGCWDDGHIPCFLLLLPTFPRIFYNVYIFISWSNNFYIKARRATRGFFVGLT